MRVDFYLSPQTTAQARLQLACRILAKAYAQQQATFVYTDSLKSAQQLDELLWTYQDISFIPHAQASENIEPVPLIQISHQQPPVQQVILMNLAPDIPAYHTQFERIIEIVTQEPSIKQQGREHYRYYQQQDYALNTHQIKH
jgi:DNA polymerase III subunit chi